MMRTVIYTGATLVMMPRWDRELAGAADLALEGHHLDQHPDDGDRPAGQPQLRQLRPVSSLVHIGGGGAAMPQAGGAAPARSSSALRYVEGYGLTETAAPSRSNPPERPSSSAWAFRSSSCDARVVDPETLARAAAAASGARSSCTGRRCSTATGSSPGGHRGDAFVEIRRQALLPHRRPGAHRRGRLLLHHRPPQAHDQCVRLQGLAGRGRGADVPPPGHPGGLRDRRARRLPRRDGQGAWWCCSAGAQGQVSEQDIVTWCRENMAVYKVPRIVQFTVRCPN